MSLTMKEIAERIRVARIERATAAAARAQIVAKMKGDTNELLKKIQDDLREAKADAEARAKETAEHLAQHNQTRVKETAELMKTIHEKMKEIAADIKDDARQTRDMLHYAKDQRLIRHEELMTDIKNDLRRQRDEIEANRAAVRQTLDKYAKERAEAKEAWTQIASGIPIKTTSTKTPPKTQFSIAIPFSKPE